MPSFSFSHCFLSRLQVSPNIIWVQYYMYVSHSHLPDYFENVKVIKHPSLLFQIMSGLSEMQHLQNEKI